MALLYSEHELLEIGQKIWKERAHRWFTDFEIFLILSIPKTLGIPIHNNLDRKPQGIY